MPNVDDQTLQSVFIPKLGPEMHVYMLQNYYIGLHLFSIIEGYFYLDKNRGNYFFLLCLGSSWLPVFLVAIFPTLSEQLRALVGWLVAITEIRAGNEEVITRRCRRHYNQSQSHQITIMPVGKGSVRGKKVASI